jgi:hypothetical protein
VTFPGIWDSANRLAEIFEVASALLTPGANIKNVTGSDFLVVGHGFKSRDETRKLSDSRYQEIPYRDLARRVTPRELSVKVLDKSIPRLEEIFQAECKIFAMSRQLCVRYRHLANKVQGLTSKR